jgi:ATP-binding cassette subfamily B protein/ATP-binding cassette subfamily B multidrug efflux pump
MLGIGFWGLFDRFLTVGDFAATVYILQRLSAGSFTFLQMGQQIFRALGTIKDAMPVMTTPPTITDRPDATELTVSRGGIRFENVRFAYKSGKPVIDDLSLTVRPGEKVGLVGLSGAGKTTLAACCCVFTI